jgi:hypothetical protein
MPMEYTLHIRLPVELVEQVDRIQGQITKASGVPITRSMVIRSLLEQGVERYKQGWDKVKASEPARRSSSVPEPELEDDESEVPVGAVPCPLV